MAENSAIEWTDATWNPITGCSIKSPGCKRCYAMKLAGTRLKHHPSRKGLTKVVNGNIVWNGKVRFNEGWLLDPVRWKRPRMVFVCAHGDLFHEDVPDAWIDKVFAVMALAHWHTLQVLTKRSERMRAYMNAPGVRDRIIAMMHKLLTAWPRRARSSPFTAIAWPLPNVWLGVSAERQQEADERIPDLLATLAAVRLVSLEPLLGPIDLTTLRGKPMDFDGAPRRAHWINALTGEHGNFILQGCRAVLSDRLSSLDWIIVGGESGNGATPMHPAWARSLRDQCAAAGKLDRFFFKQWGEYVPCRAPVLEWSEPDGLKNVTITVLPDSGTPELGTQTDKQLRRAVLGRDCAPMARVGKKKAGRLLDGVEHNGMPV